MTQIDLQEVFQGLQAFGVNLKELQTIDCFGKSEEEIEKEITKRVSLLSLHINKSLNIDLDEFQVSVGEEVNEQDSTIQLDFHIEGVLN
ncbi:hypothetical protein ABES25_06035 [Bacillus gobiensis]|uniref:hypothetical protein n=1 Tax=Bacillus gobiensis TaxID=1441095 RepID=UPI003D197EE4